MPSSLATSGTEAPEASFSSAWRSLRTICSGVCLFFIESPPSARFGRLDSHSSWISFRGAGQTETRMRRRVNCSTLHGRLVMVLRSLRHPLRASAIRSCRTQRPPTGSQNDFTCRERRRHGRPDRPRKLPRTQLRFFPPLLRGGGRDGKSRHPSSVVGQVDGRYHFDLSGAPLRLRSPVAQGHYRPHYPDAPLH